MIYELGSSSSGKQRNTLKSYTKWNVFIERRVGQGSWDKEIISNNK